MQVEEMTVPEAKKHTCRANGSPCRKCGYDVAAETAFFVLAAGVRAEAVQSAIARVTEAHGLTLGALRHKSRLGPLVAARRELARELDGLGLQLKEIGLILDRDHSTVFHMIHAA